MATAAAAPAGPRRLGRLRTRLARRKAAFTALSHNPQLRGLSIALVGSVTAEGLFAVAIAVFAFDVGGAKAVAGLAIARPALAAVASPIASSLCDRFRRERILVTTDFARAATLCGMAAAAAMGADWVVYVLAAVLAIVATAFWPAQARAQRTGVTDEQAHVGSHGGRGAGDAQPRPEPLPSAIVRH